MTLCLQPMPENLKLERLNKQDGARHADRPADPVCVLDAGHSGWCEAGYGLPPWDPKAPPIIQLQQPEWQEVGVTAAGGRVYARPMDAD